MNNEESNVGASIARPLINTHKNNTTHVGAAWYAAQGITIISLVITIILMLILAGVVLNLTIGERGIFETAQSTKDIQRIAEYKDNVEISRTGVAVDNLGKVTLDNLIEEIYKDKIVPEGNIKKLNETEAKMTTEEGYVFIITADGIEYIDKKENIPNPDLKEGTITFSLNPEGWTNGNIKVSINKDTEENLTLKYSLDKLTWRTYEKEIEIEENKTVYACLENMLGEQGSHANIKVTKIDKLPPKEFTPSIKTSTNSIEIDASKAEDKEETKSYGKSGIKEIWYSKDNGITWQINEEKTSLAYKYEELTQNTEYNIKVKVIDVAGNETITQTQKVTTKTVDIATGNITINAPTWNASTHKASVTITKGSSVASGLSIQYQVNSVAGTWTTGTSVTNLNLNDTVYARLWDGTNGGSYTSLKITEKTAPTGVALSAGNVSNKKITLTATGTDAQSGIASYKFYVNNSLVSTQTSATYQWTSTFGDYNGYVIITDKAGNQTKSSTISFSDYTISTKAELEKFRDSVNAGNSYYGKTVTQVANIDLQSTNWTPINYFNGKYDGQHYNISNLYFYRDDTRGGPLSAGLFRDIGESGTVMSVNIWNMNISVRTSTANNVVAGGVAAFNHGLIWCCGVYDGLMRNYVWSTDDVWLGAYSGGIVGQNYGEIKGCRNSAAIHAYNDWSCPTNFHACFAGGIAGVNDGLIENSYNVGYIYARSYNASFSGGISGLRANPIRQCYNAGSVMQFYTNGGMTTDQKGFRNYCEVRWNWWSI